MLRSKWRQYELGYKIRKNKSNCSIDNSEESNSVNNDKYELEKIKMEIRNEINKLISLNEYENKLV